MIRKLMALPCLLAIAVACGQGRTDDQNAGAGTGSETGALPADTGYAGGGIDDSTAAPSANVPDTTAPAGDSAAVGGEATNQDQSGVTNTESGQSELGDDATKTTPDQGAPVTSKGDTVGTSGTGTTSDTAK